MLQTAVLCKIADSIVRLPGFKPGSIITSCVVWDKLLSLSGTIYLMGLLRGLHD